jgi:serine/threonine protein kinase
MAEAPLQPGVRLGKYQVIAHLATGGMGAIYKATDTELRRTVALKVLARRLAMRGPDLERFRREARHAARLNHPNIVTLYECGYDADHDLHYLALEFVDGIDLEAHIRRKGRLAPEEARRFLVQAAKALDHAFAKGVIHRDIKPSNFLLTQNGPKTLIKLTDMGLARLADEDEYKVTRDGTTVGTVDYMPPEQARDSRATDIRSDIYSLGCTAYHMLAGRPPFAEGGLGERVYKHQTAPPPDVRRLNPAVSADFWAVVEKMLAKNQEDRYATPGELLRALQRIDAEAPEDESPPPDLPDDRGASGGEVSETPPQRSNVPTPRSTPSAPRVPPAGPARASDPAVRGDRPRPTRPRPGDTPPASAAATLGTSEQTRAAAFHERALQVLAEGGGEDYAHELLDNCLKLDPFNPAYRKTLRDVNRKAAGGVLGRLFGSLNALALKSKMRLARSGGEWRKVLEQGEDVLARQPADVETHLWMAEAAEVLGLPELAAWLLEQGREQVPDHAGLVRALARVREKTKTWKQALALWQEVLRLDPRDREAPRKINDLAAEDVMAHRNLRR